VTLREKDAGVAETGDKNEMKNEMVTPTIDLVPVAKEHVPEIACICFKAFRDVQTRHNQPVDFPSEEVAAHVIGMLTSVPGFYGVAALRGGKVIGSNFLSLLDPVAAVGPITVDPTAQSGGVGRALMLDVLEQARRRGVASVRLMQEAYNRASLSLYASLGFEQREALAMMEPGHDSPVASAHDPQVRPMTEGDLPAVEDLSRRIYRSSRHGDAAFALSAGFPAFVRERSGHISGYLIPGMLGHTVAATNDDVLTILRTAVRPLPAPFSRVFVPLSNGPLFQALLADGWRVQKVFNLMTVGPYERPTGTWMPSIGY
jgi:predicted N-acetyltransferase YhbS